MYYCRKVIFPQLSGLSHIFYLSQSPSLSVRFQSIYGQFVLVSLILTIFLLLLSFSFYLSFSLHIYISLSLFLSVSRDTYGQFVRVSLILTIFLLLLSFSFYLPFSVHIYISVYINISISLFVILFTIHIHPISLSYSLLISLILIFGYNPFLFKSQTLFTEIQNHAQIFLLSRFIDLPLYLYLSLSLSNDYHWPFPTKPFDLEGLVQGVTFKILTARPGLSVRISQIHFKKITFMKLFFSLYLIRIYSGIKPLIPEQKYKHTRDLITGSLHLYLYICFSPTFPISLCITNP